MAPCELLENYIRGHFGRYVFLNKVFKGSFFLFKKKILHSSKSMFISQMVLKSHAWLPTEISEKNAECSSNLVRVRNKRNFWWKFELTSFPSSSEIPKTTHMAGFSHLWKKGPPWIRVASENCTWSWVILSFLLIDPFSRPLLSKALFRRRWFQRLCERVGCFSNHNSGFLCSAKEGTSGLQRFRGAA